MNTQTEKLSYEAPKMTLVGSLEQVTQGHATGARTDAAFPTGTPFGSLTFS